ncbi:MAG: transporter substrate-binding domain-containing protein [Ketobacteraceae bacterium]|nr:transporter substrate-binding domain-containing protein [Ketobacteraceae bacterium]
MAHFPKGSLHNICVKLLLASVSAFFSIVSVADEGPAKPLFTLYQESFPKYYSTDGGQSYQGLCIEIIDALQEEMPGYQLKNKGGAAPIKRVESLLVSGEIDFFVGMARNAAREEKILYIDTPLYSVNHVIALRRDDRAQLQSFADLAAAGSILTTKDSGTARFLEKQKGLDVDDGARTIEANLKKLVNNRGRVLYFHDIGLYSAVKQLGYSDSVRIGAHSFKHYQHYLVLRKDLPIAHVDSFIRAVELLKNSGKLDAISKNYKSQ